MASAITGAVNVLGLATTCYLLAIYDLVLPAQSVALLIALSLAVVGLHVICGLLDVVRSRVLSRGGGALHAALRDNVFDAIQLLPLRVRTLRDPLLPVRDLDRVRAFLSGAGAVALLDLPWVPVYLLALTLLNPDLGLFALGAAAVVSMLALATDSLTAGMKQAAAKAGAARLDFCQMVVRHAEMAHGRESSEGLETRWLALSETHDAHLWAAHDASSALAGASKSVRLIVQSGMFGFGAYLMMRAEISADIMMAASILMARMLAPIEAASAQWRGMIAARQSFRRLTVLCEALEVERARPHGESVQVEHDGQVERGSRVTPGRCSSI